ncbi:serine/threonine protein kinase [Paludibaculum fermentans]|uniref:serine/threonine protein kinase n=1 Tax=Paludibaculum fermentans TaxID=1473598 RepID=UPI003EB925EF
MRNAWIGEYHVVDLIGAGGMGEVYKAIHSHLGRVIAIKVLSPELADGAALKRFYSEADIQASLQHPGVAQYFGFYEYEGRPCILMEFVEGETLAALIARRGPLPAGEAVDIIREIAEVAAHFHARGVIHRDLKTSNIKITPAGQVKILDFGIAQHQRSERLTRAGAVAGTPTTLAPEQLRAEPVTRATDVWQLGILFYEVLSGRLPFQADSSQEVFARILFTPCPDITACRPGIPPDVARIVATCLEKDPLRRYPSAAELHQALHRLSAKPPQPAQAPSDRPYKIVIAAAVALLAILAVTAVAIRGGRPARPHPAPAVVEQPAQPDLKSVTVDTMDGAAGVYRDGILLGMTPYQIGVRPGETVSLVLRREGFQDLPIQFEPTERSIYTYTLQSRKRPGQ